MWRLCLYVENINVNVYLVWLLDSCVGYNTPLDNLGAVAGPKDDLTGWRLYRLFVHIPMSEALPDAPGWERSLPEVSSNPCSCIVMDDLQSWLLYKVKQTKTLNSGSFRGTCLTTWSTLPGDGTSFLLCIYMYLHLFLTSSMRRLYASTALT